MIFIGYQGIGKTTLASKNNKYIDLESSHFFVDGKRQDNWYKIYCRIAMALNKQGYNVFTSSHKVVRDELFRISPCDVTIIHPAQNLKEAWVSKLEERYKGDRSDKNYKAYMNAKNRYDENIDELTQDAIPHKIEIPNMGYDLETVLMSVLND